MPNDRSSNDPVVLRLTKEERQAVLRSQLSAGNGVRRSRSLLSAEKKLHDAIRESLPVPEQPST
jgi:hypothetical protein